MPSNYRRNAHLDLQDLESRAVPAIGGLFTIGNLAAIRTMTEHPTFATSTQNPAPTTPSTTQHPMAALAVSGTTALAKVGTVVEVVRKSWGDGATIDLTIRNTTANNMVGWTVEFDAPFQITDIWNARIVSQSGNHYVLKNIPNFWNVTVKPGATVTFGFNTQFDPGTPTYLQNVTLNGKAPDSGGNKSGSTTGTVTQTVRGFWGTGSTNDITVRNTGTKSMVGWTVEFDSAFTITDVWNAQLVSQTGNHYVFTNTPGFWNATIKPNATIKFGFNTTFDSGTDTAIQNILLNGVAVPGGGSGSGNTGGSTTGTVAQSVRNDWGNGSTDDVTVKNTGTTSMIGWKVEFDAAFTITDVWNAQLVSHAGNHYVFTNIPGFWNSTIKAGASVTFGFNTMFDPGTDTSVQNILLDGIAVSNSGSGNGGAGGNQSFTATVTQAIRAQWVDGTTNDMTINNTGATTINGWTVTFDAPFDITNVWNAQLVSHVGTKYTIGNIPGFWNTKIGPNTQITFGFNTHYNPGDNLNVSNITLNGKAV